MKPINNIVYYIQLQLQKGGNGPWSHLCLHQPELIWERRSRQSSNQTQPNFNRLRPRAIICSILSVLFCTPAGENKRLAKRTLRQAKFARSNGKGGEGGEGGRQQGEGEAFQYRRSLRETMSHAC